MTPRPPLPSAAARRRDPDAFRRALVAWEEWDALHPEGLQAHLVDRPEPGRASRGDPGRPRWGDGWRRALRSGRPPRRAPLVRTGA